jgi:hypothetical protein
MNLDTIQQDIASLPPDTQQIIVELVENNISNPWKNPIKAQSNLNYQFLIICFLSLEDV